jgi:hypothetical protein
MIREFGETSLRLGLELEQKRMKIDGKVIRIYRSFEKPEYSHIKFIRLRSDKEVEDFEGSLVG